MSDADRAARFSDMARQIEELVALADAENEFVLAATLENARIMLTDGLISPTLTG